MPDSPFTLCAGCPRDATKQCFCGSNLCDDCVHQPGSGMPGVPAIHGPHGHVGHDEAPPPAATAGPDRQSLDQVRDNLTNTVVISLRQAEEQGMGEALRARKVVDDIGLSLIVTLMSGMMTGAPPTEGSPG